VSRREEVFDIVADPLARTDVGATNPDLARLRAMCDRLASTPGA